MNRKRKGTRCEHKSRKLLEAAGYRVTRAGGSLGTFDLIAVGARGVLLVQVKSNRWPGAPEWAEIAAFPVPRGAVKLVHRWRDRQAAPDVRQVC